MKIREEKTTDIEQIWKVNSEAFEGNTEANLVNTLRSSGCEYVSLVAEMDGEIVGHVIFTPVELTGDEKTLRMMGLGPMAVLSQYQNQGIGSELVKKGIERCKTTGIDAIVVLGHPGYYPKFGFVPSSNYGIKSEYEVPDEVFMIMELKSGSLNGHEGIVVYQDAFRSV